MFTMFTLKLLFLFIFGVFGLSVGINGVRGHHIGVMQFCMLIGSGIGFAWCQGWLVP